MPPAALKRNGKILVDNRCFDRDGQASQATAEAVPADETNAKLKVNFLPAVVRWIPFTDGDYWVLKIDSQYRVALGGTPDRKYLWLLGREASIPAPVLDEYLSEGRRQGFILDRLIYPRNTGRDVTDVMLESD